MWYPSSLTTDGITPPCTERQSLNHRTAREVPVNTIYITNVG